MGWNRFSGMELVNFNVWEGPGGTKPQSHQLSLAAERSWRGHLSAAKGLVPPQPLLPTALAFEVSQHPKIRIQGTGLQQNLGLMFFPHLWREMWCPLVFYGTYLKLALPSTCHAHHQGSHLFQYLTVRTLIFLRIVGSPIYCLHQKFLQALLLFVLFVQIPEPELVSTGCPGQCNAVNKSFYSLHGEVLVHPTRQGFSRILPRLVEPNIYQNLVLQLPCSSPGGASTVPLQCSGHHPTLLKAISLITWNISIGKIVLGLLLRLWVLLNPCSPTPLSPVCSLPGEDVQEFSFTGISTTVKLQWMQN